MNEKSELNNFPIQYIEKDKTFVLRTDNTCYAFKILYNKYLVHVYYGTKEGYENAKYIPEVKDFAPYIDSIGIEFSKDVAPLEYSFFGSGDFRTNSLKIRNTNGDSVTDFNYKNYKIYKGKNLSEALPLASPDNNTYTLEIDLRDDLHNFSLTLYYSVFPESDIICRRSTIKNLNSHKVFIEKISSLTLDLPFGDYDMITLSGQYNNECNFERFKVSKGNTSIYSRYGTSGHQHNPFFAVCKPETNEVSGNAWGFNLIYSGDFLQEVETSRGKLRIQSGINPQTFRGCLLENESFESPEAVMTYTAQGLSQMSNNFHSFIRGHIIKAKPDSYKPIVLNSWEACFFNINEELLLYFSKECKAIGVDLLVMDDGWFGKRDDDSSSLGDWIEDRKKFKNGLQDFVKKVQSNGVDFGIWVEPEMISPNSVLYEKHSEWVLGAVGRKLSLSRKQLCLDMTNPEVIEYLKKRFSKTFEGIRIDYIKWDMNRYLSEVGTKNLPPEKQGEASHSFLLGAYKLLKWFREKWPNAIIETCSGGGGRFDLGMMCFSDQIWTSDNTSPEARIKIQHGVSFAYPAYVMSCHVSNPKNICEDLNELDFRYKVAASGPLGYELNILNTSENFKSSVKSQIKQFKSFQHIIMFGRVQRILSPQIDGASVFYYESDGEYLLYILPLAEIETQKTISMPTIDEGKLYIDKLSGKEYNGENLKTKFSISLKNKNATIMYFVPKK